MIRQKPSEEGTQNVEAISIEGSIQIKEDVSLWCNKQLGLGDIHRSL